MSDEPKSSPESLPDIDPNEFIIPAVNVHDHSRPISFRIQPGHYASLEEIVASKVFPYNSVSQVLRHGMWRHLKWLEKLATEKGVELTWNTAQTDVIVTIVREMQFNQQYLDIVDSLSKQVDDLLRIKQEGMAQTMLNKVLHQINQMPDGPWKEMYDREIRERFRYLLGKPGMNLAELTSE